MNLPNSETSETTVENLKRKASNSYPAGSEGPRKKSVDIKAEEGVSSSSKDISLAKEVSQKADTYELSDSNGLSPISDEQKIFDHAIIVPKRPPQLRFYKKKTGIAYDVRMRYHSRPIADPISYIDPHPEDPRRTFRIYRAIAEAGLVEDETLQGSDHLGDLMKKLPTREATEEELGLVHTNAMIQFIKSTAGMQLEDLQHETDHGDSIYLNNDSNEAARLSAGGAIEACKGVVEGQVKNAIAVIRPPGHHAEPGNPAGFCLFANVAIASQVMLQNYPEQVKKILIFDWDVHHGNGTQRAFLCDDRVLYISIHRYDKGTFYPGTTFGGIHIVGEGVGEGFTVNIPWPCGGMGDGDYLTAFHKIIMPIASEFDPDLVIVSAGFDAAHGDPIGGCHVTPEGYQHMLTYLMSLAEGKTVVCLEGGYNLDAISRSALAITKVLLGDPPGKVSSSLACDAALEVFAEVQATHSRFWKSMGPPTIKFEPEIEAYNRQQQKLSEKAEHAREESSGDASNSAIPSQENANSSSEPAVVQPIELSDKVIDSTKINSDGLRAPSQVYSEKNSPAPVSSQDSSNEDDPSEMAVLRSLLSVIWSSEVSNLSRYFSFAKLPLLRAPPIDSEILSTPHIYSQDRVVIIFHGPSLVWAHQDPISGRIRPDESVVVNPVVSYIKWAIKKGYGVVDVFLTPLETITPAKLVPIICENSLRFFKARKIVIIGAGQAYGYAVQTAAHRELKNRLSAIVCFVGPEDTLRQFPSSSDEAAVRRFHNQSLIFTAQNHNTWKQKYARKKCGRLIKANGMNLYSVMREKFNEAVEYIEAEDGDEEDDDEEDEDENSD